MLIVILEFLAQVQNLLSDIPGPGRWTSTFHQTGMCIVHTGAIT